MPKRLLIILLTMSVVIVGLGCISREEFFSEIGVFNKMEKGKYNDLDVSIELQKTTFKIGEMVSILFILKNNGEDLIELDDKGFDAGIYRPDGTLVTYIRGDSDTSKPMVLGTDVSLVEYLDWNIYNIDPGKYHIIGYLKAGVTYKNSGDKIDSYTVKTKSLTIIIE